MLAALVVALRSLCADLRWTPSGRARASGTPSTIGGVQAHREASPAPLPRSTALDAARQRAFLGEMLAAEGRTGEARVLLRRVVDVPLDLEWAGVQEEGDHALEKD